jgi:hypothetical protein
MANVRGSDYCFVTRTNKGTGLRDKDHVGVQRGVVIGAYRSKTCKRVLARLVLGGTLRVRDHSKRTGVQQNDQTHEKRL